EVLDAIDHNDDFSFQEELGDLLLQVVLHAQVAEDRHAFSTTEVIRGITEKMVRRHPHVFAAVQVRGSAEVAQNWEQIKAAEKQESGRETSRVAGLDRMPESWPAHHETEDARGTKGPTRRPRSLGGRARPLPISCQ